MQLKSARSYAPLSIVAALLAMALKFGAYFLTKSVGLFSDAAESPVNLITALFALWALTLAAKPPDTSYAFGQSKAEYFASGLEGALILVAGVAIAFEASQRLAHPQALEQIGLGLGLSVVATAINGGVGLILLRAGRRLRSITLRADAQHLFTDVLVSCGVLLGVLLVKLTGFLVLDPALALIVATYIFWTGMRLLRETGAGLLDMALPEAEQQIIADILADYEKNGILFHALRTRVAGSRQFVSFHILVPGDWTVQSGHQLCEEIELRIIKALPGTNVVTHLEPLSDPISWADRDLDRIT
ncbi:MAG: cation diffusion facilitator family transporter [Rhizonema sp. PD38]|nr:cation diffusion facilitator family transporter [Rhizonema sp. PD38]